MADISKGFHIVDIGRVAPQAANGREWRAGTAHAALSFDGGHQSGLFTADKSTGTHLDPHVEVKPPAFNVLSQIALFIADINGVLESLAVSYTHLTLPTNREV